MTKLIVAFRNFADAPKNASTSTSDKTSVPGKLVTVIDEPVTFTASTETA